MRFQTVLNASSRCVVPKINSQELALKQTAVHVNWCLGDVNIDSNPLIQVNRFNLDSDLLKLLTDKSKKSVVNVPVKVVELVAPHLPPLVFEFPEQSFRKCLNEKSIFDCLVHLWCCALHEIFAVTGMARPQCSRNMPQAVD